MGGVEGGRGGERKWEEQQRKQPAGTKKRTKKGKESSVDSENVDGVVVARDGL